MMPHNSLQKHGGAWDYVHDTIIDRISNLYIDCPECENIIGDDEQYQCGTCDGGARINVMGWIKKQTDEQRTER
jgi:hypothetical protein